MMLADETNLLGLIAVADQVKDNAAKILKKLEKMHI